MFQMNNKYDNINLLFFYHCLSLQRYIIIMFFFNLFPLKLFIFSTFVFSFKGFEPLIDIDKLYMLFFLTNYVCMSKNNSPLVNI